MLLCNVVCLLCLCMCFVDPSSSVPVQAHLVRALTFGEWMVEEIAGKAHIYALYAIYIIYSNTST